MADQITDADLEQLTGRKSLLERAKDARRELLRSIKEAKDDEYLDLCDDAVEMMRDILGMTPGEISGVQFERGSHDNLREKVEFEVDAFHFRVRYVEKAITVDRSGIKETIAHEKVPVYQFRPKRTNNWETFETLADIGKPFGVKLDD